MADPSYGGVNIFGPCPTSRRAAPPNDRQLNAFPGVAGLESINLGPRASYTEFEGLWAGATPEDVGAFMAQVEAIKRKGLVSVLVDTMGVTSDDAILETYETAGESRYAPGWGWTKAYRMRFLHLNFAS